MKEYIVRLYSSSLDDFWSGVPSTPLNVISGKSEKVLVFANSESNATYIALQAFPKMKVSGIDKGFNLSIYVEREAGQEGYIVWGSYELKFIPVDTRSPKLTNLLTPDSSPP